MKVLIIGAGRMGRKIAETLSMDSIYVKLLDLDQNKLNKINESPKLDLVQGDALNLKFLEELNIPDFDFIISVTSSERINMYISSYCKRLGAKYTITRINTSDHTKELYELKSSFGIDYFISTELEVARSIEYFIFDKFKTMSDFFIGGKIEVFGYKVEYDEEFEGIPLSEIGSLSTVLVVGISREGKLLLPTGSTKIARGDFLYIMGLAKDIYKFKENHLNIGVKPKTRNVIIVGESGISTVLAERLKDEDINVKIVVNSLPALKKYRNTLYGPLITMGDYRDFKFILENKFNDEDVFVSVTEFDELNIMMALLAKSRGAGVVLPLVKNQSYNLILDDLKIDATLDPTLIGANRISAKVLGDGVISTFVTFKGQGDICEAKLLPSNSNIGKRVEELGLPAGIVIGAIKRAEGTVIIPRGKSVLMEGDTLVVFHTIENREEVSRLFSGKRLRRFFK